MMDENESFQLRRELAELDVRRRTGSKRSRRLSIPTFNNVHVPKRANIFL